MRILETGNLRPNTSLSRNERDWIYNGLDCCVTLEIRDALIPFLDNIASSTYQFSLDLQAPILEMSMRGLKVNQKRRFEVLRVIRAKIAILNDQLTQIVRDGIGMPVENVAAKGKNKEKMWWRSPAQLKILLYDVMGLPIQKKRNAKGLMAPSTDRTSLEKLDAYFIAEPVVAHLLALRDLDKKRGWLETEIDTDGRMRSNFNIAGTNTGRLASSLSDFGTGGNLQNIDRDLRSVFIADPGMKFGNLDLEQADSRNLGALCWERFRESHGEKFAGAYLDLCESGDLHTQVSRMARPALPWTDDPKANRAIADTKYYRNDSYRDLDKKLGHGCLTADHEVLTPLGWVSITRTPDEIMTWSPTKSEFAKVSTWTSKVYEGELQYFKGNSIDVVMTHDHRVPFKKDQYSSILHVKAAIDGPGLAMPLGGDYVGGTEIVPARLIAAHMCDGHQETNWASFHFVKQRKFARIMKLASEAGYEWKINGDKVRVKGRFPKHPGPFMFNWTAGCLSDFIDELKYWDGHIGKTSVSIHSSIREDLEWYQTFGRLVGIGGTIQKPQISGYGTTMYTLQQNNRRWAAGTSVTHFKQQAVVQVYCPTVPSSFFYVRRKGKIFVTGNSNYLGAARTMAKHSKVPIKEVEEFQRNYFRNLPCIPAYHDYVRREISDSASLITLFGRRRFFFGRPKDDATIREAVAFCPQSMTAEEINIGMLHVWRAKKVQLLVQVHDSILFQYPEELEDEIIPWALKTLRIPLTLTHDREFVVPTEAKVGYNWGEFDKDKNPDGLVKWKGIGSDGRKRTDLNWALKLGD